MKKAKNIAATQSILQNIINNETITARMAYLWERWQDEKEYEDFTEYVTNLEMIAIEQGFTLLSLTDRPFCATFQAEEGMVAVITCKAKGNKLAFEGVTETAKLSKVKRNPKAAAMFAQTFVADGAVGAAEYAKEELGVIEITKLEALLLRWIVDNEYQGGEGVVDYPIWAPEVSDFGAKTFKSKKSLGGVVSSLSQKELIKHVSDNTPLNNTGDGRTSDTVAITEAGLLALNAHVAESAETHEDAPSNVELEERINDLASRKGRGYANAGKKYEHSGVRIEEFKIGKVKVKKGDKLFFKIGKSEVSGVFSHLNQCVHCPEGYAVIRFEGKNYERRQSRVSTHNTEA